MSNGKPTVIDKTTPGRTHYKAMVDTNYLGQWDLPPGREATVLIAKIEPYRPPRPRMVKLPDGRKVPEPDKRLAIYFQGKKKAWLAGPVSLDAIAKIYGPVVQDWIGKAITLYVDADVEFGGKRTGGVRVRPTAPRAGTTPTADPLDRPVDEDKAREIDEAAGRQPGDD